MKFSRAKRLTLFLMTIAVTGCGKGFNEKESGLYGSLQAEQAEALYQSKMSPLNKKLGIHSGWMIISIIDNQFWARIRVENFSTKEMHAQYVHTGGLCPTMADDTNGDGYLDFPEVVAVAGEILIPFDSNLSSQMRGLNDFPRMKKYGFYFYSEATNFANLINDLEAKDDYALDSITKLKGENLNLTQRVILIYGVNESKLLPATVGSFNGYPSQITVPIACGTIQDGPATLAGQN